jgi:hypothetical protein
VTDYALIVAADEKWITKFLFKFYQKKGKAKGFFGEPQTA